MRSFAFSTWGCRMLFIRFVNRAVQAVRRSHPEGRQSATRRWSGLLLFKQTGLLFVRSTDSPSLRARSRDGHRRKLLSAIQQHRLVGLRDFCSGNELPQLAQARRADLQ
jgi:hypothetical protein